MVINFGTLCSYKTCVIAIATTKIKHVTHTTYATDLHTVQQAELTAIWVLPRILKSKWVWFQ